MNTFMIGDVVKIASSTYTQYPLEYFDMSGKCIPDPRRIGNLQEDFIKVRFQNDRILWVKREDLVKVVDN